MIKLYTDNRYLTEVYRRQIFPLLFDLVYKKSSFISKYYVLVNSPQESDVIVIPIDYTSFKRHTTAHNNLLNQSKQLEIPLWIYTAGDYGYTTKIANSITFRLGGFASKLSETTFILPSFINDPYDEFLSQEFSVLKKNIKPSIGFVGHAQSGLQKYLKESLSYVKHNLKSIITGALIDKQPFYPSSIKRAKYLEHLSQCQGLNTKFILRDNYRAGANTTNSKRKSTEEFYNNIVNTAYTFCIRGVGNFSVRFYETLAVGRIPILLNTDCKLPLENSIDWSKHCLILDVTSKISIENQIVNYHESLSNEDFETLQKSNRLLWLNMLTREHYFLQIYKHFKAQIK